MWKNTQLAYIERLKICINGSFKTPEHFVIILKLMRSYVALLCIFKANKGSFNSFTDILRSVLIAHFHIFENIEQSFYQISLYFLLSLVLFQ